jgi:hypothetical protein
LYFLKILKKKQVYLIFEDFFGKNTKNKKILFFGGWKLFEGFFDKKKKNNAEKLVEIKGLQKL